MKELTIEQKAERYDKAIEKAKIYTSSDYPIMVVQDVVTDIFPELKESKEEKIKKEILKIVQHYSTSLNFKHTVSEEDMIAWLEKQGEQSKGKSALEAAKEEKVDNQNCVKPTDKVEPKFKAKDWYVSEVDGKIHNMYYSDDNDEPEHLLPQKCMYYTCIKDYYSSDNTHLYVKGHIYKYFFDGYYINNESHFDLLLANSFAEKYFEPTKDEDWIVCEHDNAISKPMQYKEFKKEVTQKIIKNLEDIELTPKLRLWTIEDAKDGDVLISKDNNPFIYNGNHDSFCVGAYCGVIIGGRFDFSTKKCNWTENSDIHPATKEQRDTLFKAMADAGYKFNFETKDLKRIAK